MIKASECNLMKIKTKILKKVLQWNDPPIFETFATADKSVQLPSRLQRCFRTENTNFNTPRSIGSTEKLINRIYYH